MTRRTPYQSRPEDASNADAYYDSSESQRYHSNSEVYLKQQQLTCRALDLLVTNQTAAAFSGSLVADIGCGSGLSSSVLNHLRIPWIGLDIGQQMLQIASDAARYGMEAIPVSPSNPSERPPCFAGNDLCLSDMGQGIPLRPYCLDAAISISALQWLLPPSSSSISSSSSRDMTSQSTASHLQASSCNRAATFYKCLARCLKPGGVAVAQFYPRDASEAQVLVSAAAAACLTTHLIVDCPHRTPARKYYLHTVKPCKQASSTTAATAVVDTPNRAGDAKCDVSASSDECVAAAAAAAATGSMIAPRCPLGHPIGGVCSTWWRQQQQQESSQQGSSSSSTKASTSALRDLLPVDCSSIDSWMYSLHIKHSKKLMRLMFRAAVDAGYARQCTAVIHTPPAPAAAPATAADATQQSTLLKLLLEYDLDCCRSNSTDNDAAANMTSDTVSTCGATTCGTSCRPDAPCLLNCCGNTLLLTVIASCQDLITAGLVDQQVLTPVAVTATGAGTTAAAAAAAACQAMTADHAVHLGQQVAAAFKLALSAGACRTQQQQQAAVRMLSAEWVTAAAKQQAPFGQQQQQATNRPSRRARKQYMQAKLTPIQHDTMPELVHHSSRASGSGSCHSSPVNDMMRIGSSCELDKNHTTSLLVTWQQLESAETFPPHRICCLSYAATQQKEAIAQESTALGSSSVDGLQKSSPCVAQQLLSLLASGVRRVRAVGETQDNLLQPCLHIHGGLAVLDAAASGWQLMLGCY